MKKPNMFRVHVSVTMCDLNDQINGCLNYRNMRMVVGVKYYCPSIDYRRINDNEKDTKMIISVEYHHFI